MISRRLSIVDQGVTIHKRGQRIQVLRKESVLVEARIADLEQICCFGQIELTSAARQALLRSGVDVVFMTRNGRYRGRMSGPWSYNGARRMSQLRCCFEVERSRSLAAAIVAGKIHNQRLVLLRVQRERPSESVARGVGEMRRLIASSATAPDLDTLMGLEGRAAAIYFGHFQHLLLNREFVFENRNRRPPRDPVNACLSFGYALLGSLMKDYVERVGLDPAIGVFHQPAQNRPSLVLDLIEEFRPVMVDRMVVRMINHAQLGAGDFENPNLPSLESLAALVDQSLGDPADVETGEEDEEKEELLEVDIFDANAGALEAESGAPKAEAEGAIEPESAPAVHLGGSGRKVFLSAWHRRLREQTYYQAQAGRLTWAEIMLAQVYQMARVFEGRAESYVPFQLR